MVFSEKLQKLRKENNLSQEELARELNVSRQAISKWELGTLPDINNLVKLSTFFDCSLDYLMSDNKTDETKKDETKKELDLMNLIKPELTNEDEQISESLPRRTSNKVILFAYIFMLCSILSMISIKILSLIYPASMIRQTEDGRWYVGIVGFIDSHNLQSIITLLFLIFIISFTLIALYPLKQRMIQHEIFTVGNLCICIGYIIIVICNSYIFYELTNSPYFSIRISEVLLLFFLLIMGCMILIIGKHYTRRSDYE